jgi:glutaredoxin
MTTPSIRLLPAALLLAMVLPAAAQYKVTGPDGRVTYTDQPPTQTGAKVQSVNLSGAGSGPDLSALPTALRQVASRYPVTLYASKNCAPCDSGRQLLTQRGIPFTEKRVDSQADITALLRQNADGTVPQLTIGSQRLKGLVSADWQSYLDAAGYPRESALPATYRAPAAVALAPAAPAPAPAAAPAPVKKTDEPAPRTDGPNIRF